MLGVVCSVLVFCVLSLTSYAHQPRIVYDLNIDEKTPVMIENPEVSQAFYGSLKGHPDYFRIVSNESFSFYLEVLVPYVDGIGTDVSVEVFSDGEEVLTLDGSDFKWEYYYEEYAGDAYYKGPEKKKDISAGTYNIRVSSSDNSGKYVLVVGEREEFPVSEILKTLWTLPFLKEGFFNRCWVTAYFNRVGVYLVAFLGAVVFVVVGGYLLIKLYRRVWKKKV